MKGFPGPPHMWAFPLHCTSTISDGVFVSIFIIFCFQAFCETLEEGNYRLQKELLEKQREISSLKKMLEEKELYIHLLEKRIK